MFRKTFASVDLDSIRQNIQNIEAGLKGRQSIIAVVKAGAYGHGAVAVSKTALLAGADMLAVALSEEAIELRSAGIGSAIMVLGRSNSEQLSFAVKLGLQPTVFCAEDIEYFDKKLAENQKRGSVHLKIDTGMGRIGLRTDEELGAVLKALEKCDNVDLAGVFTHFSCSDEEDGSYTEMQAEKFRRFTARIVQAGYSPMVHASNSAGALQHPALHFDGVRLGISMYGYYPSGEVKKSAELKPAMKVFAEISHIKTLPAGECVGYGATYRTSGETKVATVQIGYGDGYSRLLSNSGRMILHTKNGAAYAPIIGRVCMDQTMLDITGLEGVREGDTALVMGRMGELSINADDIAKQCGTISYEVLLGFSGRVPRIYGEQE